jgi:hypothetical protein
MIRQPIYRAEAALFAGRAPSPAARVTAAPTTRPGGGMFSKENKRFTLLVIAIVCIAVGTIICITAMSITGHGKDYILLTGVSGVLLAQLVIALRSEQNRTESKIERAEIKDAMRETKETVQGIEQKTNGNLTNAIRQVAQEVKAAAEESAPGQEAMPKTREELRRLLQEFADDMCNTIASKAATMAAEKAAAAASEAAVGATQRVFREEIARFRPFQTGQQGQQGA